MLDWFKKKEIIDDPPDEPNGVVSFCDPTDPQEEFGKSKSVDEFINKISKNNEGSKF